MNLARRLRRVATIESGSISGVATRREHLVDPFPALKDQAKFMPTLRVESTQSEVPKFCRTVSTKLT